MPFKLFGFLGLSLYFACGALFYPVLGVLGYMTQYMIGPVTKWWYVPLRPFGIRYALLFAALTAVGILFNRNELRFKEILVRQEILALLLLLLIWVLSLVGPETIRYNLTDHVSIKFTKVMFFCLMMTHVVTNTKYLNWVFWLIVACTLFLGIDAYEVPRSAFVGGRLDGRIGGTDFRDSNALAAFMVAATTLTGTVFMRTSWAGKLLCSATAVFAMNTIVLCRSRGAVMALIGAGIAIIVGAPRHLRSRLIIGVLIALAGMAYVSDPQFLARMGAISNHASSTLQGDQSSDSSVNARIEVWKGGLAMFRDHPFGVGPGNFNQYIGRYTRVEVKLSPHSTYIQVAAELGFIGLILLLLLMANAVRMIIKVLRDTATLPDPDRSILQWSSCGLGAVIAGYAACGVTAHLLYFEAFWWFLLLPVCLERASENAHEDLLIAIPESPAGEAGSDNVA